ncbi:MAG: dockerin type I domain-containing protein, partial [Planctomycetota bacterium]
SVEIEFPEILIGDVNIDGEINLLDVAPFIERLSALNYQCEADINGDRKVDLLDVDPFVDLLAN